MLAFDEGELIRRLESLPPVCRIAFAAACAERLRSGYRSFRMKMGQTETDALERALDSVWTDPSLIGVKDKMENQIEELETLIPQEDRVREPWSQEATNAQNAGMAIIYALRARISGDSQEAAWSARVAYEAVDNFVINTEDIDTNIPGAERKVLSHPIVQSELARQQGNLEELLELKDSETSTIMARMRDRARVDAAGFFGPALCR